MIRYKVVDSNNNVIGITTDLTLQYIQYNEDRSNIRLSRNAKNAFGISLNGQVYSLVKDITDYNYVQLITIGRNEYDYLNKLLTEESVEYINDDSYDVIQESIDTSSITLAINKKIIEMKQKCNELIINGIDLTLSDNQLYHFDLSVEDQLNLQTIQYQLSQGIQNIPFHCKDGEFKYYNHLDLNNIINAANSHILYHNTYFNSLKKYIKSLKTLKSIQAIEYGIEIPAKYKSDILISLEK